MRDEQRQTNATLKDILLLLKGNPINQDDKGLTGAVTWLKVRVFKLERWKDRTVAWVVGCSFGAGAGMSGLIYTVINHFKTSK